MVSNGIHEIKNAKRGVSILKDSPNKRQGRVHVCEGRSSTCVHQLMCGARVCVCVYMCVCVCVHVHCMHTHALCM